MAVADCRPQSAQPVHLYRVINICNSLKQVHFKTKSVLSCYCRTVKDCLSGLKRFTEFPSIWGRVLQLCGNPHTPPSCSPPHEAQCLRACDPPQSRVTQWLPPLFQTHFLGIDFLFLCETRFRLQNCLSKYSTKNQITSYLIFCGYLKKKKCKYFYSWFWVACKCCKLGKYVKIHLFPHFSFHSGVFPGLNPTTGTWGRYSHLQLLISGHLH